MTKTGLEDFGERLVALLPRLQIEIARYEQNYLTEGKITQPQFLVLDYLIDHSPAQMTELAAIMNLQCSSMTGLIDRLFKQKLVQRVRTEEDRRVVKVSITEKGTKIVREIHNQKKKSLTRVFSRLGAGERQTYLEILEKLFNSLSSECKAEEEIGSKNAK